MIDSKGRIIDYYGKSVRTKLALNKTSPRIVWVGECSRINGLFQTSGKQKDICLTVGHLGNTEYFTKIIHGTYDVNYDDLVKFLNPDDEKIDTELINNRLYDNLPENTEIDNLVIQPSTDLGRFSIIDFYSTMTIQASLVDYTSPDSLDTRLKRQDLGERTKRTPVNIYGYPNGNGFYLLSLENGVVDVVFHWKTCGVSQTYPNIKKVIKRHSGTGSYILASARKVRCDQDNISSIFEDSPFSSAAKLRENQPYVAYWKKGMDSAITATSLPNEDVQFRLVDSDLYYKF